MAFVIAIVQLDNRNNLAYTKGDIQVDISGMQAENLRAAAAAARAAADGGFRSRSSSQVLREPMLPPEW